MANAPRALIGALDRERSARLIGALDTCNARFGRGAVVPAAAGLPAKRGWATKFEMRSPRYTTRVDELPTARAEPVLTSLFRSVAPQIPNARRRYPAPQVVP
jgi:DNA polymerase V